MQSIRIIAGLMTGAALLSSGSALALAPSVAPDIEIFASGASAQDTNVEKLFGELCVGGTLDTYYDNVNSAKPGANHRALFCTLDTKLVTGLDSSNPKVLFHKRSAGGSAYGVNNVMNNQAIEAMAVTASNCKQDPAEAKKDAAGNPVWRCDAATGTSNILSKASDVGVSDVNPTLFRGLNTPTGGTDVNITDVPKKLVVQSGGALVFGVPVTKSLRDALQRAQIDQGRLGAACEGDDTEACMPSLSRYQIASLATGSIGKWSKLYVAANGTTKKLTDYAKASEISGDDKVYICRRVRGSGTQTQFNAKFLNYPCAGSAGGTPVEAPNPLTGPMVVMNSGAGDVDVCLDDFNNGTNNGKNNTTSAKVWAIGLQSTEKNATLSYGYRFIKVDGVAPTLENAATGRYLDFAEVTWQWLQPGVAGAPTGDKLKIIQKIAKDAGKPSILAGIDAGLKHPFGYGGYLAVSAAGNTVPAGYTFSVANPISTYTHAPGKAALDNCRTPVVDPGKDSPL